MFNFLKNSNKQTPKNVENETPLEVPEDENVIDVDAPYERGILDEDEIYTSAEIQSLSEVTDREDDEAAWDSNSFPD